MILQIYYSNKNIKELKSLKKLKTDFIFRSKLARFITPQIITTCVKYNYLESIYTAPKPIGTRWNILMNNLKRQFPEVPVIRARRFFNAFYTSDLDKIIPSMNESDIDSFCKEFGIDKSELLNNLSPHMVVMGDALANPATLAHELGHYYNTIGKGSPAAKKAHDKYASATKRSVRNKALGLLTLGTGIATEVINLTSGVDLSMLASIQSYVSSGLYSSAILLSTPVLEAEKYASKSGLEFLIKAGSTKEELDLFEYDLDQAYNTYRKFYRIDSIKESATGLILGTLFGIL